MLQYKHPEGSDWERRALYNGYEELLKETHDLTFDIPQATYSFGQDVTLQVQPQPLECRVSWVRVLPEVLIFLRKSDCLGCVVLLFLVCLTSLASFISH